MRSDADHGRMAVTDWTPELIGAAIDAGGSMHDRLARTLLPVTNQIAMQELAPWGSQYDRRPAELRDDVAQDVMLKLLSDRGHVLRQWKPHLGLALRGFIRYVVRFHVLQLFRTARRNPWRSEPTSPEALDQLARQQPDLLHVVCVWQTRDLLLAQESARGRLLYRGLIVEHRLAEDLARELDMTRDAIYQWRARFKRRTAKILDTLEPNRKDRS